MSKHELAKTKICRWCCCKVGKIRIVSNNLRDTKLGALYSKIFEETDVSDDNRPYVVCNTCKIYLLKRTSGQSSIIIPARFNWPNIRNTRLRTCNEQNLCPMCSESSRFGPRNQAQVSIIHNTKGRPPIASPRKVLKVCNKCFSIMRPGISHSCLKTTLKDNTFRILEHHQALITFVGDEIFRRANPPSDSATHLQLPTSSGGNPLHITVTSSEHIEPTSKHFKMDFSHISQLKSTGSSMSNKQLKNITQIIRKVGVPCPSMNDYYAERHLVCDDIFECVQLDLDFSKEKYTSDIKETWIMRCCNINHLIEKVYNIKGQVEVHDLHFKLGLDYGRGFTKLVLCLQFENSVNDLVYLWVGSAPENNHNFSVILKNNEITQLIENYHVSFTFDLKAAALCLGIMSGRHPCIWCNWDSRTGLKKIDWSLRSSSHHDRMFRKLCDEYGGDSKKHAIDCDGVEDAEAFNIWMTDYMQVFNLPELHLLLGIGQKLYDAIISTMSEDERLAHESLLKQHNITRSIYHGGAFEGNAMRKITKNITNLGFPPNNSSYIALQSFSQLVNSCFGKEIVGDTELLVYQFEEAYIQSGNSCSTKVHVVCRHLTTFIRDYLPKGVGLGAVSEQATESAHSRFKNVWEKCYKCNEASDRYPQLLFNAVCDLNFVDFIHDSNI